MAATATRRLACRLYAILVVALAVNCAEGAERSSDIDTKNGVHRYSAVTGALSENSYWPGTTVPPGHMFCFPHADDAFLSYGFFVPLHSNNRCSDFFFGEEPERLHFSTQPMIDAEFSDNWKQFEESCNESRDIVSARFEEAGILIDGLPSRICTSLYKGETGIDLYSKRIFARRGEGADAFFFLIEVVAETKNRDQAEAFLSKAVPLIKVAR